MKRNVYLLPSIVFIFIFFLLSIVQLKVENKMLLAERFLDGAGWIEIIIISFYGAFVFRKMKNPVSVPIWRKRTWMIFSVIFFGQLIIGLAGYEKFLMTGKLHLPVPMMIIGGPLYRGEISFMPLLFISTVIISGPAWCSHLCYFGAFDNLSASGKTGREPLRNKILIKSIVLLLVVAAVIILRAFEIPLLPATILAGGFGIGGVIIIGILSIKRKKMVHCIVYCPVGTIVNFARYINPARIYIDKDCTLCMKCTSACKYDSLNPIDIKGGKPGLTCTLCGDCLSACHQNSIKYRYFRLSPETSRNLWLAITIILHSVFLALARI